MRRSRALEILNHTGIPPEDGPTSVLYRNSAGKKEYVTLGRKGSIVTVTAGRFPFRRTFRFRTDEITIQQ
ncbi:MAG TPA: hypothetical protein VHP31_10855 [Caproicibacter sp.]|nr:hypothetical protein [Caproicibacter sp.]